MASDKEYPTTKEIIYLLGLGTLVAASIVLPGLGIAAGHIMRMKKKHDFENQQKAWQKFNLPLLKRNLKRLQKQKIVEVKEIDGQEVIKLTEKGHTKYLKFRMEEISFKTKSWKWDEKWRVVIYDVSHLKKNQQESFRKMLQQMNFYKLQESVYLTPWKCKEAIEYLREYFNLGEEVLLMEVSKLENDFYFKKYFGL